MPFDDEDNAYPAPVTEPGTLPEVRNLACQVGSSGFGWMRVYTRFVGGIQLLYAAVFGRWAYTCFDRVYERLVQAEGVFKGFHQKSYLDKEELLIGTVLALLSLCGLIGGTSLLRLRSVARSWETAYLGWLSVLFVAFETFSLGRSADAKTISDDLKVFFLFFLFFGVLYLPFLAISPPPHELPRVGKAKPSKPVVDDLYDGSGLASGLRSREPVETP
jgi:hypothetical protein